MGKLLRRMWRYVTATLTGKFDELADPKVQLEQAIVEAQEQHRRLKEQAANVIANQKQSEMRLDRAMQELEKLNGSARQALVMAEDARSRGDGARATEFEQAAESFANRLVAVEQEVEDLKELALQAARASDQAKAAVQQNATVLQSKLAERQKLLSQLDQAKMAEQLNRAMDSLSETVGQDVPTFAEVRDKIEGRYARAQGRTELAAESVESRMLEVEQAQLSTQAQERLSKLRSELGIAGPQQASPAATAAPTLEEGA
ncbi:MAG TPA: PspA/IM30 family protein [Nitriliruptorales bacterium]|nr:PspA/IM30 family protein [Nitriliruptorales bacterium]